MLSCGWQGANKVFQSRKYYGRYAVRKLPLAAVGLMVWKGRSQEAEKLGRELILEIKLGDREILGLCDLMMPVAGLLVIGASLEGRT